MNLQEPQGAAKEFERYVQQLYSKGALLHGHLWGVFLDDPRFMPIFLKAADVIGRRTREIPIE